MRLSYITFSVGAILILIVSCSQSSRTRHYLLFENSAKTGTTDFVHIRLDDQPFSIELRARYDSTIGSNYKLYLQVGVYGSPTFDKHALTLSPANIHMKVNGNAIEQFSLPIKDTAGCPWEFLSSHFFLLNKDSLDCYNDSTQIQLTISFDGFATYAGKAVVIESVVAFDPWFCRIIESV